MSAGRPDSPSSGRDEIPANTMGGQARTSGRLQTMFRKVHGPGARRNGAGLFLCVLLFIGDWTV